MQTTNPAPTYTATLLRSDRITAPESKEDVRNLVFRTDDPGFDGRIGNCIRVLAPGQYGNPHHARFYSIADLDRRDAGATEFALCVRRCFVIDDFNGEEYAGVASNYLCDLRPGDSINFAGPVGYPFAVPTNRDANILMVGMGTGIAPFRGLIRLIYEKVGGWKGKVRLFYGARSGLEMLYMNDENNDLANYYDQPTFKAFQAISPRPALDAPIALDKALEQNAAEVWEMLQGSDTQVYIAGATAMLGMVDKALTGVAGSHLAWQGRRQQLLAENRWHEVLY